MPDKHVPAGKLVMQQEPSGTHVLRSGEPVASLCGVGWLYRICGTANATALAHPTNCDSGPCVWGIGDHVVPASSA
jgi:hypothetical protein